jgi:hypothetical protein
MERTINVNTPTDDFGDGLPATVIHKDFKVATDFAPLFHIIEKYLPDMRVHLADVDRRQLTPKHQGGHSTAVRGLGAIKQRLRGHTQLAALFPTGALVLDVDIKIKDGKQRKGASQLCAKIGIKYVVQPTEMETELHCLTLLDKHFDTLSVITHSGGRHYYFVNDKIHRDFKLTGCPDVDVRSGSQGYVIAPSGYKDKDGKGWAIYNDVSPQFMPEEMANWQNKVLVEGRLNKSKGVPITLEQFNKALSLLPAGIGRQSGLLDESGASKEDKEKFSSGHGDKGWIDLMMCMSVTRVVDEDGNELDDVEMESRVREWSATGANYNAEEFDKQWSDLKKRNADNPQGMGTLYDCAYLCGYRGAWRVPFTVGAFVPPEYIHEFAMDYIDGLMVRESTFDEPDNWEEEEVTAAQGRDAVLPDEPEILQGYIIKGKLHNFYGLPKTLKSTVLVYLAVAVSGGVEFFGRKTLRMPVYMLLTEDTLLTTRNKVRLACSKWKVKEEDLWLSYRCRRADALWATVDSRTYQIRPQPFLVKTFKRLMAFQRKYHGQHFLFLCDIRGDLIQMSTNSDDVVRTFNKRILADLMYRLDCTALYTFHQGRAGAARGDSGGAVGNAGNVKGQMSNVRSDGKTEGDVERFRFGLVQANDLKASSIEFRVVSEKVEGAGRTVQWLEVIAEKSEDPKEKAEKAAKGREAEHRFYGRLCWEAVNLLDDLGPFTIHTVANQMAELAADGLENGTTPWAINVEGAEKMSTGLSTLKSKLRTLLKGKITRHGLEGGYIRDELGVFVSKPRGGKLKVALVKDAKAAPKNYDPSTEDERPA